MPPKKATSEQYKALVALVSESECIRWGKGSHEVKKMAWEKIAASLNAIGGVEKNYEGWKKAFTEFKSHIKTKIRGNKPLNDTERKCAEISGLFASCSGLPEVPELGLGVQTESVTTTLRQNVTNELGQNEYFYVEELEVSPVPQDSPDLDSESTQEPGLEEAAAVKPKKVVTKKKPKSTSSFERQKTTVGQYELYLHFKRCKHSNEEGAFEELCFQVNKEPNGPQRSPANWKRVFSEWEAKVKRKARRIHFEQEITGGGVPIMEILTNIEKKLLEILSKISIYGHPQIRELGFTRKITNKNTLTYKTGKNATKKRRKLLTQHMKLNKFLEKNLKLVENSLNVLKASFYVLNKALDNIISELS